MKNIKIEFVIKPFYEGDLDIPFEKCATVGVKWSEEKENSRKNCIARGEKIRHVYSNDGNLPNHHHVMEVADNGKRLVKIENGTNGMWIPIPADMLPKLIEELQKFQAKLSQKKKS
jgi:hypothetical protein